MRYPNHKKKATIGVTAPSSGVPEALHSLLSESQKSMEAKGYLLHIGETVWTQDKAKSAPAAKRAKEFMEMITDETIDFIIPPWGGELFMEMVDKIDYSILPEKWILGYSDTSALLLAVTLKTGIATAHGVNLVDLRGSYSDETTAMWETVLSTKKGGCIIQSSSDFYQKEWQHENPSPCVFHLTEETKWKTISENAVELEGRILAGCIDIIRHLIGTPYGDIQTFRENHTKGEPIIWVLENCELNTADLRRSLIQMKLAGWFDNCSGILFGRSPANTPVDNYLVEDIYQALAEELAIPIVYDIDCGHVPPQITFINGAFGKVNVKNGKGTVKQTFI